MTPYIDDPDFTLYVGDSLEVLRDLPAESVHCCVTSPPYWGLRDYGTGTWDARGRRLRARISRCGTGGGRGGSGTLDKRSGDAMVATVAADACSCGATRIDQQLGLEPTPDEYVANMVAVFREVRRVLRKDGTLWLNIGDSYAGSWGNQGRKEERGTQRPINGEMLTPVLDGRYPDKGSNTGAVPAGLKPKDLVGIPWRLAFALQQPYYTGTIKDERDRIWLAAMVEAEGCMFIHKRKEGQSNGRGLRPQERQLWIWG